MRLDLGINSITNPDGTRRNVTSEVTETEHDFIARLLRIMQLANRHDHAGVDHHALQQPGYLYGDVHTALMNLLKRLFDVDAHLVYEVMLDSGEDQHHAVGLIIGERRYAGCPECGWNYPEVLQQAAARGETTLDHTPTHLCRPEPACDGGGHQLR